MSKRLAKLAIQEQLNKLPTIDLVGMVAVLDADIAALQRKRYIAAKLIRWRTRDKGRLDGAYARATDSSSGHQPPA